MSWPQILALWFAAFWIGFWIGFRFAIYAVKEARKRGYL